MRNWKLSEILRLAVVLAAAALLAACGASSPSPTATPTPKPTFTPLPLVRVALPLSLKPLRASLFSCGEREGFAVVIDDAPQSALPDDEVRLWWGEPPAGVAAYPIGRERLVAVAGRDAPASAVSADGLARAVIGQISTWQALLGGEAEGTPSPLVVVVPTEGTAAGMRLRAWLRLAPIRTDAMLAASPQAAVQFVEGTEGAIGFVPARWAQTGDVRVLQVSGAPPEWQAPVVAILRAGASREARELVACLQGR